MQNKWILDVLADLKAFAQQNELGVLAEQLNNTQLVAENELALTGEGLTVDERGAAYKVKYNIGGLGRRF